MLLRAEIHDFALVEDVVVEPATGFTVLTGETGAGKSILIDAFEFLSGSRADRNMVRSSCDKARIEALFQSEDGTEELLISREVNASGRSYAKINGEMVTMRYLREKMADIIAIHSQNDQQAIFDNNVHRNLVDAYAGDKAKKLLNSYQNLLQKLNLINTKLAELGQSPEERKAKHDFLSYQIDEIEAAELDSSEEENLLRRARTLQVLQSMAENISISLQSIVPENSEGALSLISRARHSLSEAARYSSRCRELEAEIAEIEDQMEDVVHELNLMSEKISFDPRQMELIDQRLLLINKLKDKYGKNIDEVLVYCEEAKEELAFIEDSSRLYQKKEAERQDILQQLEITAKKLLQVRKEAAQELCREIEKELKSLNMQDVSFSVEIKEAKNKSNPFPRDPQNISFLLSANLGEPLQPLVNIASGGEASRILLAIKTVLAEVDNVSVVIFDEIDSGISGETSQRIAEKLQSIGKHRQVLCVTHSAQIAAAADKHLFISKSVSEGRSRTVLKELKNEERVAEIARLLSGKPDDNKSRILAQSLLQERR